jgi:hypothetical protein
MMNCVQPQRERKEVRITKDETVLEITDHLMVDEPGLPGLVARGVMPFRYLRLRADFKKRFAGCEVPFDVNMVLRTEGYWDADKDADSPSDADRIADKRADKPQLADRIADIVTSETNSPDIGEQIDDNWEQIANPEERRRAYNRVNKRKQRAKP